jgi:hypothetical protein
MWPEALRETSNRKVCLTLGGWQHGFVTSCEPPAPSSARAATGAGTAFAAAPLPRPRPRPRPTTERITKTLALHLVELLCKSSPEPPKLGPPLTQSTTVIQSVAIKRFLCVLSNCTKEHSIRILGFRTTVTFQVSNVSDKFDTYLNYGSSLTTTVPALAGLAVQRQA